MEHMRRPHCSIVRARLTAALRLVQASSQCTWLRHRRYWNDPDVLRKLGTAMGDMPVPGAGATANGHAVGQAADEDEEDAAEEDEEPTVHSAASTGVLFALRRVTKISCDITCRKKLPPCAGALSAIQMSLF